MILLAMGLWDVIGWLAWGGFFLSGGIWWAVFIWTGLVPGARAVQCGDNEMDHLVWDSIVAEEVLQAEGEVVEAGQEGAEALADWVFPDVDLC